MSFFFIFSARSYTRRQYIGEGNLAWRENVMHLQYYIKDFFFVFLSFRKYARKKEEEEEAYFFYPHSCPRKIFQCLSFSYWCHCVSSSWQWIKYGENFWKKNEKFIVHMDAHLCYKRNVWHTFAPSVVFGNNKINKEYEKCHLSLSCVTEMTH